ncbi:threonine ammonia-lyase [Heliobacterium gestii]|uniref:L-threonine dehydratase catabolic TdcB n=1 Tax=Heliomicrobium gestii TaxID=2699 RepID=A0A845LD21_HELGE|nr:threonine ammonia-lyase [Heliomicrobium gestii]MBM7866385.1 threonine dehydratase [Heliomicrobium gestii]MZP42830.1 threonine ammonia-lyase [Heliomicrobium gestii]
MTPPEAQLSLEDIRVAAGRLEGKLHRTPFERSVTFSQLSGRDVWLKCENLQRTGSFKIRGAMNKILSLTEAERKRGVIAASAGNHAQGVALGASLLGVRATIVMPKGAPLAKVEATRDYGAQVILYGDFYDEAYKHAQEWRDRTGAVFIHAFDDPLVIAGQGTLGLEMLEQMDPIGAFDGIVLPIGGGGLAGGLALAVKSLAPQVRIVGVQAESAPAMALSKELHTHTVVACKATIADGIAVACPGDVTFGLIERLVDEVVTVNDESIAKAVTLLLERAKLVVEGSGVVGLAALLEERAGQRGERWAALLSGGNIDISAIARIIEHGLVESGRRWEFRTTLPDHPGALQRLLSEVAQGGANIISVIHDRLRPGLSLSQAEVIIALETRDQAHIEQLKAQLVARGFGIVDV